MSLILQSYSTVTLEDTFYFAQANRAGGGAANVTPNWILPPFIPIANTAAIIRDDVYVGSMWVAAGTVDPLMLGDADPLSYCASLSAQHIDQPTQQPLIGAGRQSADPGDESQPRAVIVSRRRRYRVFSISRSQALKPNYMALLEGYELDNRVVPSYPVIRPTQSKRVTISYYKENTLEPIGNLRSIDWMTYTVDLVKDTDTTIPIAGCVLGTLHCDDAATLSQISNLPTNPNSYDWSDLLPSAISSLFSSWNTLYTDSINPLAIPGSANQSRVQTETSRMLRVIGANNNHWNNRNTQTSDTNVDTLHPMFAETPFPDSPFNRHRREQPNGDYGNLIMDSIRTIEIHAALNASQYLLEEPAAIGTGTVANPQTPGKHKLDWYIKNSEKVVAIWKALGGDKYVTYVDPETNEKVDRVSTIGWYVESIARVLGLRVDEKAYIDGEKEEKYYLRQIINNPQYDKNAYGKNSFGRFGRLTPHLTNSNGKKAFDKVADLPQLIEACFEHLNRSIGTQQGTEIEVLNSTTGKKDYYPNQFAMLLDIHAKITEIQLNAKENHNLITVVSHEVRELFSVLGAAISFKSLWTRYGKLLYIGHQSDKGSILTSLTTLKMNVGMLVGNLLIARPKNPRNPLEALFTRKKK